MGVSFNSLARSLGTSALRPEMQTLVTRPLGCPRFMVEVCLVSVEVTAACVTRPGLVSPKSLQAVLRFSTFRA